MNTKPKIAILTTFYTYFKAYSLNIIVQEQIKVLLKHGYDPTVIVVGDFSPEGPYKDVNIQRIPNVTVGNDGFIKGKPAGQQLEEVEKMTKTCEGPLYEILKDQDICISHDLILQKAHLIYNAAARKVAERLPKLRWLHWIHSRPDIPPKGELTYPNKLRYERFPGDSLVVYPNSEDKTICAQSFHIKEDEVRTVHHSSDVCDTLNLSKPIRKLVEEKDLLSADIIGVYPLRLDRGKQPEKAVRLFAEFKKLGKRVRYIVMDFHSTGKEKIDYKEDIKRQAKEWGLEIGTELIFLSDVGDDFLLEVPHKWIQDLFRISDIYIHPSMTETYSLVVQEAILNKNLVVLNDDFPAMREIYGDGAVYLPFSSDIKKTTYQPSEDLYFKDRAAELVDIIVNGRNLFLYSKIRRTRNPDYIFKTEFEPLLK